MTLLKRRPSASPWTELEDPWPVCFDLAWEAYRAGTVPVGAVLTDGDGRVVGRGRTRVHDREAPPGRICGSPLAHAELDALLVLTPEQRYEGHTLWSSLEPCLLCMGAAVMASVGTVRWAGADPYAGGSSTVCENPHTARLPLAGGPLQGPMADVAAVLHLEPFLRNNASGSVATAYRRALPGVTAAADALLRSGALASAAARRAPFADVVGDVLRALE